MSESTFIGLDVHGTPVGQSSFLRGRYTGRSYLGPDARKKVLAEEEARVTARFCAWQKVWLAVCFDTTPIAGDVEGPEWAP